MIPTRSSVPILCSSGAPCSEGFIEIEEYKVLRRYRTTGQLTPKPPTGGQKPRLAATAQAMLQGMVQAQPNSTLEGLCTRVAAATGIRVSVPTMCRVLQRLGISRRQSRATPVSRLCTRSTGVHSRANGDRAVLRHSHHLQQESKR